jgi:hypothetical protein
MKIQLTLILFFVFAGLFGQQVADSLYNPPINTPEYGLGKGPVVFLDEGHHNFHTKNGRYKAFSNLLERDGYKVWEYKTLFTTEALNKGKILVVSNALNVLNVENWFLPTPSAFTEEEIKTLKKWVSGGGSLFLIADHMPMAGAAKDLAAAFDVHFTNGFVFDTIANGPSVFTKQARTLIPNKITNGRNPNENIDKIVSFTGQGFQIPKTAEPILIFDDHHVNMLPDTAWVFSRKTPRIPMLGWSQGAYLPYGKGKLVVFGEAAMFTAQIAGPQKRKMGMNNEMAPENYRLLLNIIHWLDGKLD